MSPDGSEYRNKFSHFPQSTIENKSFVDLTLFVVTSLCWNSLIVKSIVLLGFFYTFE
jgi:hypothetical protein